MSHTTENLESLIGSDDVDCCKNLRMDRATFFKLSALLEARGGLCPTKYVSVHEQLAMFLAVLSHHKKNRIVGHDYKRSGETVSKCFNSVLRAVLRLHPLLVAAPEPIGPDCDIYTWKYFPGCVGALDGTYIKVNTLAVDRPRYRCRKGEIATNALACCNKDMLFTYVLTGWEGSAADGRILRDAITRPDGLKVVKGTYYLADNGYTNGEGFLTPYRGVRYHLKEWGQGQQAPQDYREYFNMRHSRARNVIERTFGNIKTRWAILRSPSFYPLKIQNHIILSCCLINNFIRSEMAFDPIELEDQYQSDDEDDNVDTTLYVETVEPSNAWSRFRDRLAREMYGQWRLARR